MADTARDSKKKSGSGGGGGIVRAMSKKLLMPIIATAVSAIAAYAAKRGPQLLEEKILPRVKDATTGAGDAATDVADRAKSVGGTIGNAADGVAERAKSVVTSSDGGSSDAPSANGPAPSRERKPVSNDERERRWKERAEARAARRKAPAK